MTCRKCANTVRRSYYKNVSFMFLLYWSVLVFWQNLSRAQARTGFDFLIKIGLLSYFVFFYAKRAKKISIKVLPVMLFAVSLLVTSINETSFSLSDFIYYIYPVIFVLMGYAVGDKHEITKDHWMKYCKGVIVIVLYSALYALIFCWDQFENAFHISNAYGNELSSFFVSSHEYGMYLEAGIISCLVILRFSDKLTKTHKIYYITVVILFGVNLILTFSRTSMFSTLIFFSIFVVFDKGKMKNYAVLFCLVGIVVVFLSTNLQQYIFNIVMKKNTTGGRSEIYAEGLSYFNNGTFFNKMFGFGRYGTSAFFENRNGIRSMHNAYLQILVTYGYMGLCFLLCFLLTQIRENLRFMKIDRFVGVVGLGLCLSASAMMFTNTAVVFTSPIDSFFMTTYMFMVPKYIRNAIKAGRFCANL